MSSQIATSLCQLFLSTQMFVWKRLDTKGLTSKYPKRVVTQNLFTHALLISIMIDWRNNRYVDMTNSMGILL